MRRTRNRRLTEAVKFQHLAIGEIKAWGFRSPVIGSLAVGDGMYSCGRVLAEIERDKLTTLWLAPGLTHRDDEKCSV